MTDFRKYCREISSWKDLIEVESEFTAREDLKETPQPGEQTKWIFRGQPSVSMHLDTSLERAFKRLEVPGEKTHQLETRMIHEFSRSYHLYTEHQPPPARGETLEWLALMQHHGTPTRLLDFTYSLFVAAFFGLEHTADDCAVWAVKHNWLVRHLRSLAVKHVDKGEKVFTKFSDEKDGPSFRLLFRDSRLRLVAPVNPLRLNQRLIIQQGVFLCPGDVTVGFEDNLKSLSGYDDNVYKIVIKGGCRVKLLQKLHRSGLNRAVLFPGLDGFAQSLTNLAILPLFQIDDKILKLL